MWTAQRLEMMGADVQLFCRATGYPRPQITWLDKDGNRIDSSSPQYEVRTQRCRGGASDDVDALSAEAFVKCRPLLAVSSGCVWTAQILAMLVEIS